MKIADFFLTRSEAAALLGVNPNTLWRWIRAGKLEAQTVGREVLINKSDLINLRKRPTGRKPKAQMQEPTRSGTDAPVRRETYVPRPLRREREVEMPSPAETEPLMPAEAPWVLPAVPQRPRVPV